MLTFDLRAARHAALITLRRWRSLRLVPDEPPAACGQGRGTVTSIGVARPLGVAAAGDRLRAGLACRLDY